MIDYNNLTREQLAIARVKCDASLLYFTRFWFRVLKNQKFLVNWHHEEICAELDKIENYELELLNINIPPRFSKTEISAVNFIARGIGMNPTSNWLYITASDELRAQVSVSIRDIVTHPYFYIMYGVRLKKDLNSKNLWRTESGGGLKTATIFGQITGFGAGQLNEDALNDIRTFEGAIILDDLNKTDDAQEENAINEKVSRTVFNTVLSRKNSQDTPIINIQQRAGVTDVTAEFMEHFKDSKKAKFMVYPIISSDGVPLWEQKFNLDAINELRTSPKTAHVFETQYMQNATKREGMIYQREDFTYYDLLPDKFEAKHSFVDIADTGTDSHCCVIAGLFENKWYVLDVLFTKEGTEINTQLTADILNKNNPNSVVIESNMGGSMYIQLLRPLVNKSTEIYAIKNTSNKITRMVSNKKFIIDNFVLPRKSFSTEYDNFYSELFKVTKDGKYKHDDALDTLTGLAESVYSHFIHLYC
jgi:predicted phage terminase large subunit-like protein